MKLRHLIMAAAMVAAFVYFTTFAPVGPYSPGVWRGSALPWETAGGPTPGVTLAQSGGYNADEQNNIQVYKEASPAVVNITTVTLTYDFYLNPVPVEGAGSGFLIDPDGDIVTNFHVIQGARQVQVTMSDGRSYRAKVVGADDRSDLAVLRINAGHKLPYLRLGNSSTLQVGQKVLAIGNPFGRFQNTLTTGVISSVGRTVRGSGSGVVLEDVIQTDAAINQGNSGGPLLNSHGEVIGVNFLIVGPAYLGIGFAIPANRVKLIATDLVREGRVVRPWLGVATLPLNRDLAEVLELPVDQGLLVLQVTPNSPADKAGVRGGRESVVVGNWQIPVGGDIIVGLDGEPIAATEDLVRRIERKQVGDSMRITLFRGKQRLESNARLEARPAQR